MRHPAGRDGRRRQTPGQRRGRQQGETGLGVV